MRKFIIVTTAALVLSGIGAVAQEMSWKEAVKASREARKWAKEHPEEAAAYMAGANQQAAEALQRSQQAIENANVGGMFDTQAAQGLLGNEYARDAAAAKKAADARFKALPYEVRVPEGPGYTNDGNKKRPRPAYNGKPYAMAPQTFVAGKKAIVDWSKGIAPASKWVYLKREIGSAFYKAPKAVKWQGKQAVALATTELEPNLGMSYLPENFTLEFDIWSCPSTSTLPQDYSDNFFHICIWGDINEAILDMNFTPNTPGPHKYVDGFELKCSCADTHTFAKYDWEHASMNIKPNSWTHVAISVNPRDISVYVNGVCYACYNRAYFYGLPRVLWFTTQNFRDKNAYLANVKLYEL